MLPRLAVGTQEDRKTTCYRNCNLLQNLESKDKLDFLTLTELRKSKKVFERKDVHTYFENINKKILEIENKLIPEKFIIPGQNKKMSKKHLLFKKNKIEFNA